MSDKQDRQDKKILHSMTAFSRVDGAIEQASFVWELKSVNHRYLETHFKLPEKVRAWELPLRERVRSRMARGKLDIHLHLSVNEDELAFNVNTKKVQELMAAINQINTIAKLDSQPAAQQLLTWPGVLEHTELDIDALQAPIMSAFEEAIDKLLLSRQVEGEKLGELIVTRLDQIDLIVEKVRVRVPDILVEHRQRLQNRLEELKQKVDDERLAQEIILLAQKVDVAEELDRLNAHIDEVRKTLSKSEPCGRRLDFLMQELNREANTLGSKSMLVDTSQWAVDLKVLIEQMREQVQNIE